MQVYLKPHSTTLPIRPQYIWLRISENKISPLIVINNDRIYRYVGDRFMTIKESPEKKGLIRTKYFL
jgi:hypothetical protein